MSSVLRERQYLFSVGGGDFMQSVVNLLKNNLSFFLTLNHGDAEVTGKPKISYNERKKDLLIRFPITYETLKKVDDNWTEGPDKKGMFVVYVYPSSNNQLELEMGYEDEDEREMKSDRGKEAVSKSVKIKKLDWSLFKKELMQLKKQLGGVEATWI